MQNMFYRLNLIDKFLESKILKFDLKQLPVWGENNDYIGSFENLGKFSKKNFDLSFFSFQLHARNRFLVSHTVRP